MLIDIAAQDQQLDISEGVSAGGGGGRRLQLEDVLDLVTQRGRRRALGRGGHGTDFGGGVLPCAGCKLASEVFKEAAAGSPDKLWVEAMVRVHGKEKGVQSESVLPHDPWATLKGITAWSQIGNTPADPNYMVAGVPRFGGASFMRRRTWTSKPRGRSANASYDASAEVAPSRRTRRGTGTHRAGSVSRSTGERATHDDAARFVTLLGCP